MILPQDIEWRKALQSEFEKPYFEELVSFLDEERKRGVTIYPPESQIYRALDLCPPEKVKAVILGQDPYHGEGQACGLSFSVPIGVKAPPSLKNIFKELSSDLGVLTSGSTDLEPRAHEPASHSKIGWDKFTDAIISYLSEHYSGIVFMLWGNYARSKAHLIDPERHLVLEAAHPSPLARGAFWGSRPFSQANSYLTSIGRGPIDWSI